MIIASLPYTFAWQSRLDEITGCSPYGASIIAGNEGQRGLSEIELDGARLPGRYVTGIADKTSTVHPSTRTI
jgi:NAD(P)H dehydrogenase (quinone)